MESVDNEKSVHARDVDEWVLDTTIKFDNNVLLFKNSLMNAHALVIEANYLCKQLNMNIECNVVLLIPIENIRPHFQTVDVCVVMIGLKANEVTLGDSYHLTVDEFECKLEEMREMYSRLNCAEQNGQQLLRSSIKNQLEFVQDSQNQHYLIGVAFVILQPVLHPVLTFSYPTPIFNQQGEVVGRLTVCLRRIIDYKTPLNSSLIVQVRIRDAIELPEEVTNFVFCRYTFFDELKETIVRCQQSTKAGTKSNKFKSKTNVIFNHMNVFRLSDTEKIVRFQRFATEGGTLSIQVYGHPSITELASKSKPVESADQSSSDANHSDESRVLRSLAARWAGMCSHLVLWLEIHELNEAGIWSSVPLLAECEENDSENSDERILAQLKDLITEQNAVEVPTAGTGIPGALADWSPPVGMEEHVPLFFLDLDSICKEMIDIPIEDEDYTSNYLQLQILNRPSNGSVIAHWDPSLHDTPCLNRVTDPNMYIFLVFKILVKLSESAQSRQIMLRKRVAIQVVKRPFTSTQAETGFMFKKIFNTLTSSNSTNSNAPSCKSYSCGVTCQIVSKMPNALKQIESVSVLARNAAKGNRFHQEPEWLEEYLDCMQNVNENLNLEYIRQVMILDNILGQMNAPKKSLLAVIAEDDVSDACDDGTKSDCSSIQTINKSEQSENQTMISRSDAQASDDNSSGTLVCSKEIATQPDITISQESCNYQKNAANLAAHGKTKLPNEKKSIKKHPNKIPDWISVGNRTLVCTNSVKNKAGTIRFVGETSFKAGLWVGVELDEGAGRNDGTLGQTRYFTCPIDHGVFVRFDKLKQIDE